MPGRFFFNSEAMLCAWQGKRNRCQEEEEGKKKISKNLTQSHFKRIGDDTLSQR